MLDAALRELESIADCEWRRDARLSRHTSLGVGGPADLLAIPDSRDAAIRVLAGANRCELPVVVLGKGFNTLVRDGGFRGVVLALWKLRRLERSKDGRLVAEAGVSHGGVTNYCNTHGLAGLEFAAGIPGTVGGWIAMNAGVPDREMRDVLTRIDLISENGEAPYHVADLAFRYRGVSLPEGSAVLAGHFEVSDDAPEAVSERVAAHLAVRAKTQPINRPSCGSVFKNPPGDFAGRLIEDAGLKGQGSALASFSDLHANFIVTRRGARAADVLSLIDRAREAVFERSGIALETEVRILGDDA